MTSLERKVQRLEKLNTEMNRENEALYERFNDELAKMARGMAARGKRRGAKDRGAEGKPEGQEGGDEAGREKAKGGVEEVLLARLEEKEKELKALRAERAQAWRRDAVVDASSGNKDAGKTV